MVIPQPHPGPSCVRVGVRKCRWRVNSQYCIEQFRPQYDSASMHCHNQCCEADIRFFESSH